MEKSQEMKAKQASPKQWAAVGILAVLLLSVGVWQWQSLSGRAKPSRPTTQSGSTGQTSPTEPTSLTQANTGFAPFPLRDPFRPTVAITTSPPSRIAQPARSPAREISGTTPVPPVALPAPGAKLELHPAEKPTEPPPIPNWTLVGIVQGPRTLAILKDSEGNRRFVQLGDQLEEGWRVRRIARGTLTLQKGQTTISIQVGTSTQDTRGGVQQ
jgi:hypothetical protein